MVVDNMRPEASVFLVLLHQAGKIVFIGNTFQIFPRKGKPQFQFRKVESLSAANSVALIAVQKIPGQRIPDAGHMSPDPDVLHRPII